MRGIILRRQRKQISNSSLMNTERKICPVTGKTNRLKRCNFCKGVSHKVCIFTNPIKGTRAENRNHIFSICNNGKYVPWSLIVPSIDGIHTYFGITLNHNIGETISLSVSYVKEKAPVQISLLIKESPLVLVAKLSKQR